ncbi:hypothetical protein FACS1894208_10540 [Clostridia bacterium]|nr:hypothetical protein FACS1894208_10540 [Clostridia bacterium]
MYRIFLHNAFHYGIGRIVSGTGKKTQYSELPEILFENSGDAQTVADWLNAERDHWTEKLIKDSIVQMELR